MKFPKPLKITSRTSTIANAFVQAIIPFSQPTAEQLKEALSQLGMTIESICCCYCGGAATDWDHLRPLVKNKKPSGFASDYRNLVPSCGPCNQSKSGSQWETWMRGSASKSPASRKLPDIAVRIDALKKFEDWGKVKSTDFESLADHSLYSQYLQVRVEIERQMRHAQQLASELNKQIASKL